MSSWSEGVSRKPGPCSRKWADWYLSSPVLSVGGMGGVVGWCIPPLLFRVGSGVASPEFSSGDVDARSIRSLLFALGLALQTSCLIRSSLGLSVWGMVRSVEVGVRKAPGLGAGIVRGREWGSCPLLITLVLSLELSVGDVGK